MGSVGTAWAVFAVSATWRWEQANPRSLPRPSIYFGSAVIYTLLLGMASSETAAPVASALGWGLVVANLVAGNLVPGTATGQIGKAPAGAAPAAGSGGTPAATSAATAAGQGLGVN